MKSDGIARSSATLTKMSSTIRGVCKRAMKQYEKEVGQYLGDGGEFIAIDESHFRHKRKVL